MYTIELLDVVTTAGVLYIVALGLLIVYGVLKIINLAHGAFLALGSYAAVIATWLGWNPWSALVIALAAGVAIGAVAEWRVLRGLYVRPLDTILATWGLNIIIIQGITLYFGREIRFAESGISQAVSVGGVTYSLYRLVLLAVAIMESFRLCALQGADIVCIPTNWVPIPGQAQDREAMANILCMAAAHSNSLFVAAADRTGVERGQPFIGQSVIVSYTGWPIGSAASRNREEIIYAEVNLADARRGRNWNEFNQVLRDRRTDVYDEMLGTNIIPGWY